MWTSGSFFEDIFKLHMLLFVSCCIRLTKKNIYDTFNKKYIISIILSIVGYYIFDNIIFISFIHQFGYYLSDNFITKGIFNTCYNNLYLYIVNNHKQIIYILHKNFLSYIKNILYAILMKYLFFNNINYGYAFTLFITNCEKCIYTKILYGCIYISIFNKKDIIKLCILSYIGTILINLIKNMDKLKFNNTNNIKSIKIPIIRNNNIENMKEIEEQIKNAMENIDLINETDNETNISLTNISSTNKNIDNIKNDDLVIIDDFYN